MKMLAVLKEDLCMIGDILCATTGTADEYVIRDLRRRCCVLFDDGF